MENLVQKTTEMRESAMNELPLLMVMFVLPAAIVALAFVFYHYFDAIESKFQGLAAENSKEVMEER